MNENTTNSRARWVDYGKGIGIILVVYAHLLSSAYHGGIRVPDHFFNLSDRIIYSFHMPLFFFLSGLFVETSLQKRGAKEYLLDKFSRIAYPYIIWSVLQVSVEVLFSSQTQKGATFADLLAVIYRPWGQFWFLYALLLMHLTFAGFSYLGKYAKPLMFAASIALFFFPIPTDLFALAGFSAHFVFFAGGILFKEQFVKAKECNASVGLVAILLAALFGAGYYCFENLIPPQRLAGSSYPFYFLFLSMLGIVTFSALSQYLARKNTAQFLETLGRYSLQIYLVHMLAGVGLRVVLLKVFGIENWVIQIVVGVIFALMAPIILQKISDRLNFPYLFELRKQ